MHAGDLQEAHDLVRKQFRRFGQRALVRHAPEISGGLDGSLQFLTGENFALGGNAWVSGDVLMPGTPREGTDLGIAGLTAPSVNFPVK